MFQDEQNVKIIPLMSLSIQMEIFLQPNSTRISKDERMMIFIPNKKKKKNLEYSPTTCAQKNFSSKY